MGRTSQRGFAIDVVQQLRRAGYQAYWAGGCVRDLLLGRDPKDYDVATSATPPQVRDVFTRRKTLAIGESFGVISVLGPPGCGPIEVATFRQDAQYSDGRHPDRVIFSSVEEDARRRDFTINGMYFDPIAEEVLDLVDGQRDLSARIVRAIGDPAQRFAEDKLRMLRAIRFAVMLDFSIDRDTMDAVRRHCSDIRLVSEERISAEIKRMLMHPRRAQALPLLHTSGLLHSILPELQALQPDCGATGIEAPWTRTQQILERLPPDGQFIVSWAALWRESAPILEQAASTSIEVGRRLKLANREIDLTAWLIRHEARIRTAPQQRWSSVQPLLIHEGADELLCLADAVADVTGIGQADVAWCQQQRQLPADELNPAPLITGDDLLREEIPTGPHYRTILDSVRAAQLERRIGTREEAIELARSLYRAELQT